MLLYEETYAIFLKILKKEKMIEIYLENNFNKVYVLIEDESTVIRNKIRRDVDICDLTIEDTRENDKVTYMVGLAKRNDAVNMQLSNSSFFT